MTRWWAAAATFCDPRLEQKIEGDGTMGAIPATVAPLWAEGARVVYAGDLRSPGHRRGDRQ
ncbi:hypothetical protein GCM10011415_34770 [Salipiger pallidus]|uniref:Uncharacterized protein n=1 Tax=Salipiger pallidus TaxID=1775170 RepID=A0A8J2ZMF4_9RHOB|nr:hypothetical protein [Salipiger pallidus]GGG82167.1 hypothetical protein GCM10011415_34770 [Salipiger pallidus]